MGKATLFYRCRLCQQIVEVSKETPSVFVEIGGALGHYHKTIHDMTLPSKEILHKCPSTKNGYGVCDIVGGQDES